jgi:transposase
LARKKSQPLKRLGVDEKAFGRGQDYVTVVAHIQSGKSATVEYVGDGRKRESLDAFWLGLTEAQRAGVEAVGMVIIRCAPWWSARCCTPHTPQQ